MSAERKKFVKATEKAIRKADALKLSLDDLESAAGDFIGAEDTDGMTDAVSNRIRGMCLMGSEVCDIIIKYLA